MSKRFYDTALWDRPWFRQLPPEEKAAWLFIISKCDSVGVWVPDYAAGDFMVGCRIQWSDLPGKCNGNIRILDNGKWWIVDFCNFQYGELSPNCKPHASYLALLSLHGLLEIYLENHQNKGYTKGLDTVQEKEKETEKEKDNSIIIKRKKFVKPTTEEIAAYCSERQNTVSPGRFFDYYEARGWLVGKSPMKDWRAAVRTWEANNFTRGDHGPELRPDEIIIPDFSRGGRKKSTYQP